MRAYSELLRARIMKPIQHGLKAFKNQPSAIFSPKSAYFLKAGEIRLKTFHFKSTWFNKLFQKFVQPFQCGL